MVGWHPRLNGHEFEQALGVSDGQEGLAYCSPWDHKESDTTERLNWLTWGASSLSVIYFCFFILFMRFSRQECRIGLEFPPPVNLILSELSTMTYPSWVVLHGMAHNFTELHKAVIHMIILVNFLWLWFSSWRLWDYSSSDDVITDLEPDILECEVKWDLESITMNKASAGDGIPVELF